MKPKVVGQEEFNRLVMKELADRLRIAIAEGSADKVGGKDFVQLKSSLDFIVRARKKQPEPPGEEPCCVCFRSGQGIVCAGECCIEVFLPNE